jgi:hypothetical protein
VHSQFYQAGWSVVNCVMPLLAIDSKILTETEAMSAVSFCQSIAAQFNSPTYKATSGWT